MSGVEQRLLADLRGTHGTPAGYQSGCRCEDCLAGKREYQRQWRIRRRRSERLAQAVVDAALDWRRSRFTVRVTSVPPGLIDMGRPDPTGAALVDAVDAYRQAVGS